MRERRLAGVRSTISELLWALPRLSRAGNGRAFGVLSVWIAWNQVLEWLWRLRPARHGGIFRYRLARHLGSRLTLRDGAVISRGDTVLQLHFDNRRLMGMAGADDWNPWDTMVQLDADLESLADLARSGSPPFSLPRVRGSHYGQGRGISRVGRAGRGPIALHGVTLFAYPGRRLGFEVHQVSHTWTWALQRFYLISLLPIYHRDGWREFDRMRRDRWPAELWMSVDHLLERASKEAGVVRA